MSEEVFITEAEDVAVDIVENIPVITGKQSVYTFTCAKCGTLVHVNSDNSLSTNAKKNLHTCPRK